MSQPMMPVTIDPSETRRPAPPVVRPPRGRLRLVLLSGLGVLGLTGFAALASSVLGGLAGPQFVRPTIKTAALTQTASDWPDLRDGIPALAPVSATPKVPASAPVSASVPASAPLPVAAGKPVPPAPPAPVVERLPAPMPAAVTATAAPSTAASPAPPAAVKPPEAAAAPKPARLPPIENAAILPPARPASLVPATRTAALVAPSPAETTRSRATGGTFAALPPEEATKEAPKRKAPAPVVAQAPKPVAHAAKPTAQKVASAAPEPQAAEAEPEQTEVFGLKVPSLAPAGRKLVEGVEALGNAVKSLPDRF